MSVIPSTAVRHLVQGVAKNLHCRTFNDLRDSSQDREILQRFIFGRGMG